MNAAARKRVETPAPSPHSQAPTDPLRPLGPDDTVANEDDAGAAALATFRDWLHREPTQADSGVVFDNARLPGLVGRRLAAIESRAQALGTVLALIGADGQAASDHESVLSPFHVAGLQGAAEILVDSIRDQLHAIYTQYPEERAS